MIINQFAYVAVALLRERGISLRLQEDGSVRIERTGDRRMKSSERQWLTAHKDDVRACLRAELDEPLPIPSDAQRTAFLEHLARLYPSVRQLEAERIARHTPMLPGGGKYIVDKSLPSSMDSVTTYRSEPVPVAELLDSHSLGTLLSTHSVRIHDAI